MKENNDHITDMQQLAETGWKQMHETLVAQGLSTQAPVRRALFKKRNILLLAACLFIVLIFSFTFYLNKPFKAPSNSKNTASLLHSPITPVHPLQPHEMAQEKRKQPGISKANLAMLHEKMMRDFSKLKEENSISVLQKQRPLLEQRFFLERCCKTMIGATDQPIGTSIPVNKTVVKNKPSIRPKQQVKIFGGAGFNFSLADKSAGLLKGVNIHPGITLIIPLNQKLTLHTGLWALSTIHGKEVTASETQLLNNAASNLYYNVHTTSIVKASYIDLPVTINYPISKNWSVGSGLQLSRLYKVNIKEQKENFDYNNTLYSASIAQYNSTPTRAMAVFQKKATIKKYEARFVAEALFCRKNFLFSAGYYYGLGKSITLKNTDGSVQQYRNEYFKLGIQYKMNR
jgi:hypothetical protein